MAKARRNTSNGFDGLPRYPWDKWFGKQRFNLVRGRDFECLTHGMVGQVRNQAKLRGIKVSIQVEEDKIVVTQRS